MTTLTPAPRAIWAHTTTPVFHPFGPAVLAVRANGVALRALVECSTEPSDLQVAPAWQTSTDGLTWTFVDDLDAFTTTADGYKWGTLFTLDPAKRWVRPGVRAKKASSATLAFARVSLTIDLKP